MQALQCITFATAIAVGVVFAAAAQAQQKFPSKPVRIVVPNPPGSQADTLARMIGQKLSERWGQPVVVDNRTGGVGTVAGSTVAKAAPDGHTLLQTAGFAISAAFQPNLPYTLKDFAGVAQLGIGTQVLVVAPSLGVKSVKDFIALAKAQPGKILYGSSAVGTGSHLNGARFALAAGIKVVTVAFKGGPEATLEVMAGRTHYSSVTLFSALPFVNEGKLLALAVATPQRSPLLPDVPALAETLPDFRRPKFDRLAGPRRDAASDPRSDQQGCRARSRSPRHEGTAAGHGLLFRTQHAGRIRRYPARANRDLIQGREGRRPASEVKQAARSLPSGTWSSCCKP